MQLHSDMDQDPSAFLRSEKSPGGNVTLYDTKKWVWVPDEATGFLAAELKEQNGDNVVLELNNGSVGVPCNVAVVYYLFSLSMF